MSNNTTLYKRLLPFCMWFIPLLFFTYQFILRLWPGLMMEQIMHRLSIDATAFGALAASYYYGYSLMQIPVAILLDRYGARIIIFIFTTICGVASIVFFYTENYYIALVSRFLVGAGSAVGFLGVSKVSSEWFDKSLYAKMIGISFTFGLLGAIFGGKPIALLIEKYSLEAIALSLGMTSIVIGIVALLFIRNASNFTAEKLNLSGFKLVISSKNIWILAVANALLVGSLEGFADIWGIKYLVLAYSLEKNDAASLISFIFFGMLIGGPALAWLNARIKEHETIVVSSLIMVVSLGAILYRFVPQYTFPYLFFIIGITCCYQVIIFTLGSKMVCHHNVGICVAFLNSINMLGGSFYHTIIGMSMDKFWDGMLNETGEKLYKLTTYQYALSSIIVGAITGIIMIIILKKCQSKTI